MFIVFIAVLVMVHFNASFALGQPDPPSPSIPSFIEWLSNGTVSRENSPTGGGWSSVSNSPNQTPNLASQRSFPVPGSRAESLQASFGHDAESLQASFGAPFTPVMRHADATGPQFNLSLPSAPRSTPVDLRNETGHGDLDLHQSFHFDPQSNDPTMPEKVPEIPLIPALVRQPALARLIAGGPREALQRQDDDVPYANISFQILS